MPDNDYSLFIGNDDPITPQTVSILDITLYFEKDGSYLEIEPLLSFYLLLESAAVKVEGMSIKPLQVSSLT